MKRWQVLIMGVSTVALIAAAPGEVTETQAVPTPDCYDAIVSGRIVRQTPSAPECDADCILMVWPWFVEFDVRRVVKGAVPKGRLLTLSMQHTYFVQRDGAHRLWLRRNSLGGFNLVRFAREEKIPRCSEGFGPAEALVQPGPGETIDDLLREGEQKYGGRP